MSERDGSGNGQRIAAALDRLHATLARRADFGRHTGSSVIDVGGRVALFDRGGRVDDRERPAAGAGWRGFGAVALGPAQRGARRLPGDGLPAARGGARHRADLGAGHGGDRLRAPRDAAVRRGRARPGSPRSATTSSSRARRRPSDVERIVDLADRLSPVLDALTRANRVQRTIADQRAGRLTWTPRSSAGCNGRDGIAPSSHYETYWREQLRPAHERLLAAADLRPGQHVIDIACGTGMVTLPAATAVGPDGHVLATDLAQKMVDDTAARAQLAGLDQRRDPSLRRRAARRRWPVRRRPVLARADVRAVHHRRRSPRCTASCVPADRASCPSWGERRNCGWAELFPIVDARVSSDVCPMFFALGTGDCLADAPRARRLHRRRRRPGWASISSTPTRPPHSARRSSADPSPSPTHGSTTPPRRRRTTTTWRRSPRTATAPATGSPASSSSLPAGGR